MHTRIRWHMLRLAALLLVATMTIGVGPLDRNPVALKVPAAPAATTLPATTCTAGTPRTCDLWAKTGTLSLPGSAVPIWGYSDTSGGAAQLPGPPLIVNQGETVQVTLHNTLGEASSLAFPGQSLRPDMTGAAGGSSTIYTFTAANPGTYIYEAGPTPNGAHQVAMGMFGALIVRPTTNPLTQAYNDADTAFVDEALVVLSEIDPALNNSASPASFDMRYFAPQYWLINGKAYPNTATIPTAPGNTVLLRYINAGLQHHSMGLLGLDQTVLSTDGSEFNYSHGMVAETLAPGQTADVLTTIPAAPPAGTTMYALYNTNMLLHNNSQRLAPGGPLAFGGMLTFLTISGGAPPAAGPDTSNVALNPDPTNGSVPVALSATVNGTTAISAAEYFIDTPGAGGTGTAMAATDGTFNATTEAVDATISVATLTGLPSGSHTVYVHGQNAAGWGPFSSAVLHLDKAGPATSGITLSPTPTNGSVDVALRATGDDTATGNGNVDTAEYFIGTTGAPGTGTPMALNMNAPVVSLDATISAATVAGLAEGEHTISVRSKDAAGNWGAFATAKLQVDKTGPTTSGVNVAPNPNNGTMPIDPNTPAIRLDATITDPLSNGVNSNLQEAEGFIDTAGPDGSGFPLVATDGVFDSSVETAYALIPLFTVQALSDGPHDLIVHGKDEAGNWGATATTTLNVYKGSPTTSGVNATPNPTGGAATVTLTANATDGPYNIVAAEWFEGTDPGAGFGNPMTATDGAFNSTTEALTATINGVDGWTAGNHTLWVRAKDAAGNWGAAAFTTLVVQPPDVIFADGFESGDFTAWAAAVGGVSVTPAAAMFGTYGMQVIIIGEKKPAYVVDNTPNSEPNYHARFYFNPNGTDTRGDRQDIFVGFNNAGTKIFRVQYRRREKGQYQIRGMVLHNRRNRVTNWYTITNAPTSIEIAWQSGATASFSLYIDGVLKQTRTGLNTSAYLLDRVWLGPSGEAKKLKNPVPEYFDAFVSTRNSYIGP